MYSWHLRILLRSYCIVEQLINPEISGVIRKLLKERTIHEPQYEDRMIILKWGIALQSFKSWGKLTKIIIGTYSHRTCHCKIHPEQEHSLIFNS